MQNPSVLILGRDESFAEQVQEVSARVRPRLETVHCKTIGSLGEVLERDGPFDLLVAGPGTGTSAGLSRLQTIRTQYQSLSVVLAYTERPKANFRDIVRTGAVDFLPLPVDDDTLVATLQRALDLRSQSTAPAPGDADRKLSPREKGTVIAVTSASGGCGKTFYATNMGYFLHQRTGARTCILDLDLQFGEVSIALRLRPRYSISDILNRGDADQDLHEYIDEYVAEDDSGVHVLAAPSDPSDADRVQPGDVARVLEALRCRFDYVVVDMPAALTEIVLTAIELADSVHVVATLDVPSLRNMSIFLKTLQQLNVPGNEVKLVLNKVERDLGIDVDKVNKLFPQGFAMELAYARDVTRSYNLGTPVLALAPRAQISRDLEAGLASVLLEEGEGYVGDQRQPKPASLLTRVLRRSPALGPLGS